MKITAIHFYITIGLAGFLSACISDKSSHQHSESQGTASDSTAAVVWKEMDEYHLVMAESFHPYMDSANLQPAKLHAEELAKVAAKWAEAPLPEKVNNDEVRAKLDKLNATSQEFATIVKAGNDEAIGKALTDLHHLFHEVQNAWYHPNGDEGEHKHAH